MAGDAIVYQAVVELSRDPRYLPSKSATDLMFYVTHTGASLPASCEVDCQLRFHRARNIGAERGVSRDAHCRGSGADVAEDGALAQTCRSEEVRRENS